MMAKGQASFAKNIKLFIYIPSYNRPNALECQLSWLSEQVVDYRDRVRILVSDNASPGSAYDELAEEFSTDNISFRRNPNNIDGNANIALGFVFAKPDEFLWILGDSDFISPNAIEFLLAQLNEDVEFIDIHSNIRLVQEIVQYWSDGYSGILVEGNVGLISRVLHNMELISSYIDSAFYFHNSSFPHLAVILSVIKGKSEAKFKLLPYEEVFQPISSPDDGHPGDYSLSKVGMPLLVPLLTRTSAKRFCSGWLLAHGIDLYTSRFRFPHVYIQTVATLKAYGGVTARVLLVWKFIIHKVRWAIRLMRTCVKGIHYHIYKIVLKKIKH